MGVPRFFFEGELVEHQSLLLSEELSHYVQGVLRLPLGADLVLFNGRGGEFTARLEGNDKKKIRVKTLAWQAREVESRLKITLAQSISSREKMDFIVQKATELGVHAILPLYTERSSARIADEKIERRMAHWQKIAISACEQCGRNQVPSISKPAKLLEALPPLAAHDTRLLLDPGGDLAFKAMQPPGVNIAVIAGPEGGLSDNEVNLIAGNGFQRIMLGPRILRMETASLAALSAIQLMWGD